MDEKDDVFARFKDEKQAASKRREVLTIPRRAWGSGSKVVEVVRVRSSGPSKEKPRRTDTQVRAASWDEGFPAKQTATVSILVEMDAGEATAPVTHIMPAWEPTAVEAAPSAADREPVVSVHRARGRPRRQTAIAPTRHIADPFDDADQGANCLRCGYVIEPARERRGLMTCLECR